MNLVFAGTPHFAVPTLQTLVTAGHRISLVLTQPDRPSGRGRQVTFSPVKEFALAHGLAISQPSTLADQVEWLRALQPDAMIVVAYGLLLPPPVLELPRFGCINVHASLLPRWRGAAPIARAIEAGDRVTGITIMQMDRGLDTGPMLARAELPIADTDTAASLHDKLAHLGAELLVATLPGIEAGRIAPEAQTDAGATYARKLKKEEGRIDWHEPAATIARKVRAFNPWPVAHAMLDGEPLRIWSARPCLASGDQSPGTVLRADTGGLVVATGSGALLIDELQPAGGKRLGVRAFLNGRTLPAGTRLG